MTWPCYEQHSTDKLYILCLVPIQEGSFLVRCSTAQNAQQPYTLVVLFNQKVYNIPVRFLKDSSSYALGKEGKKNEEVRCKMRMMDFVFSLLLCIITIIMKKIDFKSQFWDEMLNKHKYEWDDCVSTYFCPVQLMNKWLTVGFGSGTGESIEPLSPLFVCILLLQLFDSLQEMIAHHKYNHLLLIDSKSQAKHATYLTHPVQP